MDKIEVTNKKEYLKKSKIIGIGSTAICYLDNDGIVNKFYYDMPGKDDNFQKKFNKLYQYGNETFITPQKLLVDENNNLLGYTYPYVEGKTLSFTSPFVKLEEFLDHYEEFLDDCTQFSDSGYVPSDLHGGNIIYKDGKCKIIDLDRGAFYSDLDYCYRMTARKFATGYLNKIFRAKLNETINFYNHYLQEDYQNTDWTDVYSVANLFDFICQCSKKDNPSIHDVRVKHLAYKQINEYYRY